MDGQTQNAEYDCDYVDEDINYDITHFGTNYEHKLEDNMYNKSPKSSSSVTKFQVGLSDIVNKHKASLQMYDEVCTLLMNTHLLLILTNMLNYNHENHF